jgi:hypothetical protein
VSEKDKKICLIVDDPKQIEMIEKKGQQWLVSVRSPAVLPRGKRSVKL